MANGIVNAINNFIARSKADSPVHVELNDLANAKDNVNCISNSTYSIQ